MGRYGLIAAAAALALSGCGPTPPQAPGAQAHQLNEALSSISSACGEAVQIQAFSNDRKGMNATEHSAEKPVDALASIWKQNRGWIFQGKSVAELVVMTNTFLDECGLHGAAKRLRRKTSG